MYRQYEQELEQQEADERGAQAMASPYTDKEESYDDQNMDNMHMQMHMPCGNVMGTGIKMNIGGRPMMCCPMMNDEPTLYENSESPYQGMKNMGCPAMQHHSDMYRQPSNYYHNRPHYYPNYPIRPFFPYIWYNLYPYYMPYPPYHYREDWY